jgi:hypothetical protein
LYSAFIVLAQQADKIPAPRVGLTDGRPMVVTRNPNPSQTEREKTGIDQRKTKGIQARKTQ